MKTFEQLQKECGESICGRPTELYIYQYFQAEMHEYGKELQGKILDQEFTIKSLVEDNRALKEAIEINCNCNADGCHNARLLNNLEGRANALEEWLTEYRDQLKKENVYHKNTGIINAINELLDEL